jgi:hypothetical protein
MIKHAFTLLTLIGAVAVGGGCYDDWHDDDHYDHRWEDRPAPAAPIPQCPAPDCPSGLDAVYFSADRAACAAIDYTCDAGLVPFDSVCGCGCQAPGPTAPVGDGTCPDGADPDVLYLSQEAKVCDGIEFTCPVGQERFDSSCGCGCRPTCPDSADPTVHYLSDEPMVCASIDFTCPDDCVPFDDRCGCGCIEPAIPPSCPDPDDPDVTYISGDPAICAQLTVTCPDHCRPFDDACGCGCID